MKDIIANLTFINRTPVYSEWKRCTKKVRFRQVS